MHSGSMHAAHRHILQSKFTTVVTAGISCAHPHLAGFFRYSRAFHLQLPLLLATMSDQHRPLDSTAVTIMLMLCLAWGLQQVALKLSAPYFSTAWQLGWRSAIAAFLVFCLMKWRKQTIWQAQLAKPGLLIGTFFALEFVCIAESLRFTNAAHLSVFLYMAPVFTVLGLHALNPQERLKKSQWLGILLAFSGIIAAFAGGLNQTGHQQSQMWLGDLLALVAALLWAATTITIRASRLAQAEPAQTLFYQLAGAGLILLALVVWRGEALLPATSAWNWLSVASMLFQTLGIAFISYLAWFWLLRRYLASRLAVFSFLTPLFGVSASVLILHENLHAGFILGALLVFAGIVVVNK